MLVAGFVVRGLQGVLGEMELEQSGLKMAIGSN